MRVGLAFGGVAHELEIGIGPAVEVTGLAVEIGAETGEGVELFGVGDGKWAKEERVDQAEGGSAGADGESEREDGSGGGDFIFGELADSRRWRRERRESSQGMRCWSRTRSLVCSRPPSFRRAWRRASVGDMPARRLSSMWSCEVGLEFGVEVVVGRGGAEGVRMRWKVERIMRAARSGSGRGWRWFRPIRWLRVGAGCVRRG